MPIAESSRRLPAWQPGTPVKLWNGEEWHFPAVTLGGWYPKRNEDGSIRFDPGFNRGRRYDELTDRLIATEDAMERLGLIIETAAELLSGNYAISDDDISELFYRVASTDTRRAENDAMYDDVFAVLMGRSPKAIPVGSESS